MFVRLPPVRKVIHLACIARFQPVDQGSQPLWRHGRAGTAELEPQLVSTLFQLICQQPHTLPLSRTESLLRGIPNFLLVPVVTRKNELFMTGYSQNQTIGPPDR